MKPFFIFILMALSFVSCGGQSSTENSVPVSPVTVSFLRTVANDRISQIHVDVRGGDIPNALQFNFSKEATSADVNVPIGEKRVFRAYAPFSGNRTAGYFGETTMDVTSSSTTLNMDMNFMNGAFDATGDDDPPLTTTDKSLPDIASVFLTRQNRPSVTGDDCSGRDVVQLDVDLDDRLVLSSRSQTSLLIVGEFDTDRDATTGRTVNYVESQRGTLEANFASGANFHIVGSLSSTSGISNNNVDSVSFATSPSPQGFSTVVSVYEGDDFVTPVTVFNEAIHYDPLTQTISLCMDSPIFLNHDPDGKGRFNVMVGTASFSRSLSLNGPSSNGVQWTDMAYRSGSILYDLGFDFDHPIF